MDAVANGEYLPVNCQDMTSDLEFLAKKTLALDVPGSIPSPKESSTPFTGLF